MRRAAALLLLSLVLAGAAACSSDGSANTGTGGTSGSGGGGGAGNGGRGGSAGTAGTAGTAGSGGGGGTSAAACPATPPQPGSNCTAGLNCYYEDCAGAGRTIASCVAGSVSAPRWQLTTGACTTVTCPGPSSQTCAAGQVCLVLAGGAFLAQCVSNSCGTSAISCGCIQSCSGVCTVVGSAQGGVTVSCNTCPQGGCP